MSIRKQIISMRIGLYIRVSTINQKDNSSRKFQKDLGIEFCKRNEYDYEVFEDTESGGKYDRAEFDRLKEKITNKELDGIWVYDYDRLSRDVGVGDRIKKLLIENQCKLIVGWEEKRIEKSGDSFEYNIRNVMSDFERSRIKERMDFGKKRLLADGGKLGNVGYGFEREKKRVVVNEKEAKIIKEIFKIYNYKNVKSYGSVYDRLKNKHKKEILSISSIGRLLRDKKYNGLYKGGLEGEGYSIKLKKIIDDELWKKTQLKIKQNKGVWRGNKKEFFELKGRVICGDCGENMWVIKSGEYRYYTCNSSLKSIKEKRKNSGVIFKCNSSKNKNNKISIDKLEVIIWDGLFQVLNNSKDVVNEYKNRFEKGLGTKDRFKANLRHLEGKKETIENVFQSNLQELIETKIDKKIVERINTKYAKDIEEIDIQIESIKAEEKKREVKDSISGYLELMKLDLESEHKIKRVRDRAKIIKRYIDKINVYRFNDSSGNKGYNIEMQMFLKDIGKYENENIEVQIKGIYYILKIKTS